jgi:hypothetical protein
MPLRDVQEAASHADPRTTMRYDRARTSLDRHATYIVAAYVAGAARVTRRKDHLLASTGRADDPGSCLRITEPHPRIVTLAGVAALADHLDLLPRRHLYS